MSAQPQPETAEDLMRAVKEAGLSVSSQQVARWHRTGLLPKPSQRSLGRGRGTQTVYPPGTTRQLVALIHLHKRHRYLDDVGWRLWWHGFPVSERHWLGSLRHAASCFSDIRDKAGQALALLESGDEDEADMVFADMETAVANSSAPKFVKHLRKRVGRKNFISFLCFLMKVVDGSIGDPPDATDDCDNARDLRIVAGATGLDRSQRRPPKGFLPLLFSREDIWRGFADVSSVFRDETIASRIDGISEASWIEARDELRDLMTFFQIIVMVLRPAFGKRSPYGFGIAAEIADNATTFDLAVMLIFYRALKDEVFRGNEVALIGAVRGILALYAAARRQEAA